MAQTKVTDDLIDDVAASKLTGTIADARFPATLPAKSGVNLTALNASNLGSGTVPTARLGSGTASSSTFLRGDSTYAEAGGGKVLQVVSFTLTAPYVSSSHSWVNTTLQVAITPASGTKCLVMVNFNYDVGASCYAAARLARDSTALAIGDADGVRPQVTFNCGLSDWARTTHEAGITYLDTHGADGSTAVTYRLQYDSLDSCAFYMNRSVDDPNGNSGSRPTSTITVQEIGA